MDFSGLFRDAIYTGIPICLYTHLVNIPLPEPQWMMITQLQALFHILNSDLLVY